MGASFMAAAPGSDGFLGKEESSFSAEKEAKRLSSACAGWFMQAGAMDESFLVLFFQKRTASFFSVAPPACGR
jgi:hypothetical protein